MSSIALKVLNENPKYKTIRNCNLKTVYIIGLKRLVNETLPFSKYMYFPTIITNLNGNSKTINALKAKINNDYSKDSSNTLIEYLCHILINR